MNDPLLSEVRSVGPVRLQMLSGGHGRPILFLHPGIGFRGAHALLGKLTALGHVIAPAHPGFEGSENQPGITCVDDVSYLYLDLLDELDRPAIVVGASLGGWIALEMAVKSTARIAGLVLLDSVGVRFNSRDVPDFADIYALTSEEIGQRLYRDPARARIDYPNTPTAELEIIARNREAEARFCWSPYLHSPHLGARLHRVDVPTLVLWGEQDGLAPVAYGRKLAKALPRAILQTIDGAAHFPHVEQPGAVAAAVQGFLQWLPTHTTVATQKELAQ